MVRSWQYFDNFGYYTDIDKIATKEKPLELYNSFLHTLSIDTNFDASIDNRIFIKRKMKIYTKKCVKAFKTKGITHLNL